MTRITLPYPPPISACFTNARGKGRVATPRYKAWTEESLWSLKAQKPRQFAGEVSIYVGLVAPDKRIRDAGNCDKAIMDVLVKAGVIKDDSNRYVKRVTYEWRPEGEPCVVLINDFEGSAA
jgi:crossover junction endodeoxyribonuclease RusA